MSPSSHKPEENKMAGVDGKLDGGRGGQMETREDLAGAKHQRGHYRTKVSFHQTTKRGAESLLVEFFASTRHSHKMVTKW